LFAEKRIYSWNDKDLLVGSIVCGNFSGLWNENFCWVDE